MENSSHNLKENIYDIIIAGAGCSGLSLLYSLLETPALKDQKILVIDKSFEKSNDRTWCFWEKGAGHFESLVCKQWEQISIHKNSFDTTLWANPFTYKMINGLDFYNYVINFAKKFPNVEWQEVNLTSIDTAGGLKNTNPGTHAIVSWEGGQAKGLKVFSSILPIDQLYTISKQEISAPFLWQHFKGHIVEFEANVFDDNVARLMDFNVAQKGATGFMYVLPLNASKALVEYTLFSKTILAPAAYTIEIDAYLAKHFPNMIYKVIHEEIGAIPMTTMSFAKSNAPIFTIGTLGNAVKASTGYAFQFIQAQIKQIISALVAGKDVKTEIHNTRHQFYDSVLLYILYNELMDGSEIFKRIFEKNKAATIFKFLSNTSNIWEDISIMRSLPTRIFLPAAFNVLFRRA